MKINTGKFPRIPSRYSDDLDRIIRWMLTLDVGLTSVSLRVETHSCCFAPNDQHAKRPSVDELYEHPRLQPYLREAEYIVRNWQLNYSYASKLRDLKSREEQLKKREAAVAERERLVAMREAALSKATSMSEAVDDIASKPRPLSVL